MHKIGTLLLLMFFLFDSSLVSRPSESPEHNGYWWIDQTPRDKLTFIEGYVAGMAVAYATVAQDKEREYASNPVMQKELAAELENYDFFKLPYGQLSDGLDQLYNDYRNKMVSFPGALGYVRHSIRGRTREQLDRELILIRCQASSPDDVTTCLKRSTGQE